MPVKARQNQLRSAVRLVADALLAAILGALETVLYVFRDAARIALAPASFPASRAERFVPLRRRAWLSGLPLSLQLYRRIQLRKRRPRGSDPWPIHWKGVPLLKDPFDYTLYPLLLWELKPASVIELGAFKGGSALWIADLLTAMGLEARIHSFDIDLAEVEVSDPRIRFERADTENLSTLPKERLKELPHPWLVIEDAHHNLYDLLRYFDELLQPGDYLVVEDNVNFRNYLPLRRFLLDAGDRYAVDTRFTDLFAYNGTWNVNGYLKRVR